MKEFLDTSVLVPAFREDHPHHEPRFGILEKAANSRSYCALHSLAEFYARITALPLKPPIPPEQALLFIEEIRDRLTAVSLDAGEYHQEIVRCAGQGISRGRIYDALILRCAAKSKAETIYTWNLKPFQLIVPALSHKIRTPWQQHRSHKHFSGGHEYLRALCALASVPSVLKPSQFAPERRGS